MSYAIREVFDTLQGEGARAGARSVFVRFAGCNLWSGRPEERGRGKGACARWCDTDFFRGDRLDAPALLARMAALWPPHGPQERWTVLTGGEPSLQLDLALLAALHEAGWKVAVETNGTLDPIEDGRAVLDLVDHLTVSPKIGGEVVRQRGHELKVVLPGGTSTVRGWTDGELSMMAVWNFLARYVQPQDPIDPEATGRSYLTAGLPRASTYRDHIEQCVAFVRTHSAWRLSIQIHKYAGLP